MEDMEQRWCFTQVSKNGGKRMSLITFVASPQSSESFVFGSHNWDCSSSISGFLSTKWKTAKNRVQGSSSMRIWWMIIVSTFLWHHQKNFDSSFHSFLTYRFLKQPMFITNRKNSEIEVLSPPSITKECRVITRSISAVIIIIKQENSVEQTREIPSEFFPTWGHYSWKCQKNLWGAEFFLRL